MMTRSDRNGPAGEYDALLGIGEACASAGVALGQDLFRAGLFAAQDAARSILDRGGSARPDHWLQAFMQGARTYCTEMACVLPRAVDRLSREVDRAARRPSPAAGSDTPKRREMHVIDGVPVALPVRILDASQAFAFYLVSTERARALLKDQAQPFSVVDIGDGRTPVAIQAVDYRETDLGAYQEFGVCFFVRPMDQLGNSYEMPGTLFASLTVNDRFNVRRATPLWGYNKTYTAHMQTDYTRKAAHFSVDRDDPTAFSITFPRFGSGRSTEIPCYTWGIGRDGAGTAAPVKSLITRSATGEGMQVAGDVELRLGDGAQARCICKLESGRGQACVCLMLRELGLPKRSVANSWAEHMWAVCAEGVVVRSGEASSPPR